MTDDGISLTRRKILGSIAAVGAAGAGAGLGTTAYFSDGESFDNNTVSAGELDLLLDYQVTYHGGPGRLDAIEAMGYDDVEDLGDGHYLLEEVPDTGEIEDWDEYVLENGFCAPDAREQLINGDEVAPIHLSDVKPGDSGCLTTSLHLCDNPSYVWLDGALTVDDDNGLTDPESEVDDTDGEGEGELADAIQTRVWYDENCDCALDQEGNGEPVDVCLVLDRSGSMAGSMGGMRDAAKGLVDELDESAANVGLVSYSTSATLDQGLTSTHADVKSAVDGLSANGQTHITDGVETAQDELENGANARSGARKIMVVMSDGEHNQAGDPIVAADLAKDAGTELFTVAFGNANEYTLQSMASDPWDAHFFQAADEDELIEVFGEIGQVIAGERLIFEGSLAELMDVLSTDSGIPLDGDRETDYAEIVNGSPDGGADDGREPFQPGQTHCIGLSWELPIDVGNEVQSDTVGFDVGFYAEQARHNDGAGL